MAKRIESVAVAHSAITLQIEGLRQINPGNDGPAVFELSGVAPLEIDWSTIGQTLEQAGIPQSEVERYIEDFAEVVEVGQLSKALAKRMKRLM
jgi:hypothetical protein